MSPRHMKLHLLSRGTVVFFLLSKADTESINSAKYAVRYNCYCFVKNLYYPKTYLFSLSIGATIS